MNWPFIFTSFNIQRPYLWSHCELYNVIKKAGPAPTWLTSTKKFTNLKVNLIVEYVRICNFFYTFLMNLNTAINASKLSGV